MSTTKSVLTDSNKGFALGLIAVVIFALSLPMTRLAVGGSTAPQLSPLFVTTARAALAGLFSILYLVAIRAKAPPRHIWPNLFVSGLGTVVGFPVFLALALQDVHATHAAVITGILPLATAVFAALYFREKPSIWFWICAFIGSGLVVIFAVYKGGGAVNSGDLLLLAAILSAAVGYVAGARASSVIPAAHVICWILTFTLAPMLLISGIFWPKAAASWQAWGGVVYLGIFPMWLGFFAWYRGMVLGGALRVSQVQLIQPFIALLFAVPILGEQIDQATILFSLLVLVVVYLGRRTRVN